MYNILYVTGSKKFTIPDIFSFIRSKKKLYTTNFMTRKSSIILILDTAK